jgi:Acyltransferase family
VTPLWFAIALLIFAMCYAIWQTCRRRAGWSAVSVDALPAMPALALIALGLGLLSFIVRLVMRVGTEFLWLQLGYFSCYAFFYIAGCAAARSGLLERITLRDAAGWLIVSILAISTLPLMLLIRGRLGGFEGGWNINAFYYAIWDPAVAFGVILGLLAAAQRWGGNSTQIVSRLGSTAFGALILHPPVLVALSVLAMPWAAAPVLKFIVISCAACVASFALSAAIKSLPGVSKII